MTDEVVRRGNVRPIADLPETEDGVTGLVETQIGDEFFKISASLVGGGDPALAPDTAPTEWSDEFFGPALDDKWTWLNQGTSTATFWKSRLILSPQASANPAVNRWAALVQTPPAGNWAARIRMGNYSSAVGLGGGLIARRTANSRFLTQNAYVRVAVPTGIFTETWEASDWSSFSAQNANRYGPATNDTRSRDRFFQLRYDGTNLLWDFSPDNVHFVNYGSVAVATYLGGAPDQFGIAGSSPHATERADLGFDWFRVYENANLNQG